MLAKTSSKSVSRKDQSRKRRSEKESKSSAIDQTVNKTSISVHNGQLLQPSVYHAAAVPAPARTTWQPNLITAGGNSPYIQSTPYPALAPGTVRMNHSGAATMGLSVKPTGTHMTASTAFGTGTGTNTTLVLSQAGGEAASYKDYSRVSLQLVEQEGTPAPEKPSGKDDSFPVKLHQMLSEEENIEYICWLPHGRSWRIVKPKAFEAKVVPQYFKHAKYASFMRQVNGWGFKRITEGTDHNSYYHELFLRGLPQWCHKMQRPPKAKKGASASANEASSVYPDFHHLSMIAPLPTAPGVPVEPPQYHQPPRAFVTSSPANMTPAIPSNLVQPAQFHHYGAASSPPKLIAPPRSAQPATSGHPRQRMPPQQHHHRRSAYVTSSSTSAASTSVSGDDRAEVRRNRTADAARRLADQATFSSSSSAYAGGSERSGDSSSDSGSDPLSEGGNQQNQQRKLSPELDDGQKAPRHPVAEGGQSPSTSISSEEEVKQRRDKPGAESSSSSLMQQAMQGAPGASGNMPCIVVQMPQGGNQQQQQMVFQPPQTQLVRVVNQDGTEIGYIQVPANQGMHGQNPFFQQHGQMMQGQNPQMMQGQNPQQMMQGQNPQLFQQGQMMQGHNPQMFQQGQMVQGQNPQMFQQQQGQNTQMFQQGQVMQGQNPQLFQRGQMMQAGATQQPQGHSQIMQQALQQQVIQQLPRLQMGFANDAGTSRMQ